MEFYISPVPTWVSILFLLTFPIAAWLIASAASTGFLAAGKQPEEAKTLRNRILLFYAAFLLLVAGTSIIGLFSENTLPPKILLFTAIPLFLFYFLYVSRSDWFRLVKKHIPLSTLVGIHLFRFVGVFFLIGYYFDALPKTFAFIGGWGDIISATLAIWVIYALKEKKSYAIPLTWAWNIIGMIDILNVLANAVITTRTSITDGTLGVIEFASFPFSWIPAFAPATIIFLHIVVFQRLIALRKTSSTSPTN